MDRLTETGAMDDPWGELRAIVMASAQAALDDIIPPGTDMMHIAEEDINVNAEIFKVIWMRGVQLGAELTMMTLNIDEYREGDCRNEH